MNATSSHNAYVQYLREKSKNPQENDFQSQMQEYQSGYYGGRTSRYLPMPPGIHPLGSDGDTHYQSEISYFLMVERARFQDRDNMVIGAGVNKLVSNIVQNGFIHDTKTGDEGADDALKAAWLDYTASAQQCDYEGVKTFDKMAEMALRNAIVDGDISALGTRNGSIQMKECHYNRSPWSGLRNRHRDRLKGNGIVHGVELKRGKRVAYWYTPQSVGAWSSMTTRYKSRRIPVYNRGGVRQIFHVYSPKRFTQRRGVSAFAPIVFPMKYHDDLQFAALVNAKRQSFYAIIRKLKLGAEEEPNRREGMQTQTVLPDGTIQSNTAAGPGNTIYGVPGEDISGFAPNVPGQSHFQHADLLMNIMAINLDLPMMVFFLDATKGNFNAYRGVMQQAQQRFRQIQRDLRDQFHSPIYRWFVERQLAKDYALRNAKRRLGDKIYGHSFTPMGWAYIQPQTDADADDTRLTRNLTSGRRRALERGYDYQELTTEIVEDRGTLIEKAILEAARLNKFYIKHNPDSDETKAVNWRELAYGNPRDGVKMSLQGMLPGTESQDEAPAESTPDVVE